MPGSDEYREERALIERARQGDVEAFGALVRRYLERVYRVAHAIVRNADEAADIAQDTFVRAFRRIDRFDLERPLFPWLYQIARNLALNRIERVRKRETALPEHDVLVATGPGPEEAAVAASESQRVRRAVASLPEQHRAVIDLNHFQECSYREMAEILGIPIGTVMSRLYHARQRLKKLLDEETSDVHA